jgi:hypothetical protein
LFDGKEYVLDKEDLLAIEDILKTVFENTDYEDGVLFPVENRENVMSRAGKNYIIDIKRLGKQSVYILYERCSLSDSENNL